MASLALVGSMAVAGPDAVREAELRTMLIQDCGSCHGLRMTGGLGPALQPERLAPLPDRYLVDTILRGRPGTAMPPWNGLLNADEAAWMVRNLRAGVRP